MDLEIHQWRIKLEHESLMRNRYLHGLKVSLHQILLHYRGNRNTLWRRNLLRVPVTK